MKANHIRILLLVTIAIMLISLMGRWEQTFPSNSSQSQTTQTQQDNSHYNSDTTATTNVSTSDAKASLTKTTSFSKYDDAKSVTINTDVFKNLKISLLDGAIISASLEDYSVSLDDKTPMALLTDEQGSEYIAKSTIVINKKPVDVNFESQGIKKENGKQVLTLTGSVDGLEITRTYTFDDAKYNISVSQNIKNTTSEPVNVIIDDSLARDFNPAGDSFSLLNAHSYTFTGVAYSTANDSFRKESFKDISKTNGQPTVINSQGLGWVAFIQHYFVSAWIPQSNDSKIYYKNLNNDVFEAGAYTGISIAPNQSESIDSVLYSGPIIKANLVDLAPNLEKTLDYGMLSFFSEIIFWVMNQIHSLVGNWGLAIILVTCLIKLIFYPLSAKSYRSMAKMRMLQPRVKRLQETYKDDRQALGKKMMEMYKEEKVNPLSGCLPMLIQIPIFISLYWVLLESVELRQAPFIFWIHDLSMKDPYFVLPILMGISMFLQQKLSPAPADPMQAKIMMFLPVIFTFLFASFPSGLVLYWLTNNVISILQQWIITRHYQATHKK
ncbi:membrane protein insertase YidC [Francisella philomiragia]|uniref:Membrane protein insertase YidC n=1 Tax=Francisella philomiragia TaxID=28110 RepID=A0AAW3DBE5_9GAMM|nr:membrane protein insertase YidC [Francisella philomiragia]KFJ42477.1 membrane protein insertase, YidC/Oxa1 family, N-terminal domain [Francisella philomiragia]MBK2253980.1 membrane protein insertase YidC [Francisella philomiragia]MBK2267002.1 membrane protein insertase YidC [Francisella philomiragia]MBK2272292.1 membrane protein insertase YidC [Francisella philomiragia]MBK2276134.1 membrane protein insertase YidC [Francisella philomiragia]